MILFRKTAFALFALCLAFSVRAQISSFGTPYYSFPATEKDNSATVSLAQPTAVDIKSKDSENPLFSLPSFQDLSLENSGIWQDLPNGDRVWHLKIEQEQETGTALFYKDFYLPEGAKLWYFNEDKSQVKGAYTSANNKAHGKFFTGFVKDKTAYVQYYEPKEVKGQGHFTIFRIDQMLYKEETKSAVLNFGFGTSESCHLNVNCTEGDDWQDEKRGVCRIMMVVEEGTAWCSGTLLNNERADETPYVLSAFHCTDGFTPMYDFWRFDFNYETENCVNPDTEPNFQSLLGCHYRAGRRENDFQLLEIDALIPSSYNVYFNGWDRSAGAPSETTLIHHPSADIKKISQDNQTLVIHPNQINWNNEVSTPPNRHFRGTLDAGTFQVGSSGCPFFNAQGRVVAQLHGGNLGCTNAIVYGGRIHHSWDDASTEEESLAAWLDPDNTGVMTVDALQPESTGSAIVSGRIKTQGGEGIAGVTVRVNGEEETAYTTGINGTYEFELPVGGQYLFSFEKNFNASNGVFTSDIIQIRRVILNLEDFDSPYDIYAGDVSGNDAIPATSDIVIIRQMILNLIDEFPNGVDAWRFIPQAYVFPDPTNPFTEQIPDAIFISDLQNDILNIDIIGVKTGDVNRSANPEE